MAHSPASKHALRWLCLPAAFAVCLTVASAQVLARPSISSAAAAGNGDPIATSTRIADASCEKCHESIYQSYIHTPMANASGMAAEHLKEGSLTSQSGVHYAISTSNGKAILQYEAGEPAASPVTRTLSYFLGSGHLGITYLYSINGYLLESPVAWYASSDRYDMKPGLAKLPGMPPPLPMQADCLRCHMSEVQASDAGALNRYSRLPFLHTGITCEACHGDTGEHVRTRGSSPVIDPVRLSAQRRDSICMSCHLEGDITVERSRGAALRYKPGDDLSDELAYYVYKGKDLTTRGVSEVEQFSQSRCKRSSGETMSCSSCHDPHFSPDAQQRVAFYRGRCLACHNQPAFVATHHPKDPDCTMCHMPKSGSQNIPHVAWTDHRILKAPAEHADLQTSSEMQLVPIFSPQANQRDQAMAHYLALMAGGHAQDATSAWKLLQASEDQFQPGDADALDALGVLSAEKGDIDSARTAFERVLKLDPADLTALSDLGILAAKQGKLDEASELLRTAFSRNQDIVGLGLNLARVECRQGDETATSETLKTLLTYAPGYPDAEQMLAHVHQCTKNE